MRLFSRRIHKTVREGDAVEISEQDGIRYLHLGNNTVQSAMRIKDPLHLELSYTQAMMAFLIFAPEPRSALLVGLGGGSVAKFLFHHYPDTRIRVAEINAEVIRIARQFFFVPDDTRLEIIETDATRLLPDETNHDVLLLDGYDAHFQVPALATPEFYQHCADALTPRGILSVNLWRNDPMFDHYHDRLLDCFEGRVLLLPAERRGNTIALCFNPFALKKDRRLLHQRAIELEVRHRLPYTRFLAELLPQVDRQTTD